MLHPGKLTKVMTDALARLICGHCRRPLKAQKLLPKPLDFTATNHYASVDAKVCWAK